MGLIKDFVEFVGANTSIDQKKLEVTAKNFLAEKKLEKEAQELEDKKEKKREYQRDYRARKKRNESRMKVNQTFMRKLTPTDALAAVIGSEPKPRTQMVKEIWEYIKEHDLQNPENRRNILADDKLEAVFRKKEVTMFELAVIIGKNVKEKNPSM